MVPVAGENAIGNAAFVQREAHVRATVVERVDFAFVLHQHNHVACDMHGLHARPGNVCHSGNALKGSSAICGKGLRSHDFLRWVEGECG